MFKLFFFNFNIHIIKSTLIFHIIDMINFHISEQNSKRKRNHESAPPSSLDFAMYLIDHKALSAVSLMPKVFF